MEQGNLQRGAASLLRQGPRLYVLAGFDAKQELGPGMLTLWALSCRSDVSGRHTPLARFGYEEAGGSCFLTMTR
jgi:hypothetical protein